jgi:hypothetical protein
MLPSLPGFDPGLTAPHLGADHPVRPILAAALGRRLEGRHGETGPATRAPWGAAHFGLDRVERFQRAGAMTRRRILVACARDLLTEAYYIEKLGLGFTAKMALLSETTEERMLYCLFAGDEAAHLHAIAAYVGDGAAASAPDDPFLALLTEAIAAGEKPGLTYVVQVVLEGWGIAHYQSIARDCRDGDLRRTLLRLARDEALHHGSGVALLKRRPLPERDRTFVTEVLVRLLEMVRIGPQRVVARLEELTGPLSRGQRVQVFRDLDAQAGTQRKLDLLRGLMGSTDSILDVRGTAFRALDPEECAARALHGEGSG